LLAAIALYACASAMFVAHATLLEGHAYVGIGTDPEGFIWFLNWWPYAIGHGIDPLYSTYVWVPTGSDIAAATSIPTLSFLMWPVTATAGPVVAWNVLAIASPMLAATGGYVVCRLLTKSTWPSLAGGWLLGFSSFEFGHLINDAQIFFIAWVPLLVAVIILRYRLLISARTFVLATAALLLLQMGTSVEILATFTLFLCLAGVLAYFLCSSSRSALGSLVLRTGIAYAIVAVVSLPFELAVLNGVQQVHPLTTTMVADLANYVVPTPITALGGSWVTPVTQNFTGNVAENAVYLGIPAMAICVWWAVAHWSLGWARVLFGVWVIAIVLSLGPYVHVLGVPVTSGPWKLAEVLPFFFSYALPVRLALYASFATAVMVALWVADFGRRGGWKTALAAVVAIITVVSVMPATGPVPSLWETPIAAPALFTQPAYANVIPRNSTIVALPYECIGDSMLWQVDDNMRFRMAGGCVQGFTPLNYWQYTAVQMFRLDQPGPGFEASLDRFVTAFHVDDIVIADDDMGPWSDAMQQLNWPEQQIGGACIFSVPPNLR
jgi:hypothetical protein